MSAPPAPPALVPTARDWLAGLLVALAFFAVGLLFIYREAVVEPDSVRVAYGIVRAITTGDGLETRDLYGRTFSFGYYLLFFALYPRLVAGFGPLPAVMNGLNLASTSAALFLFFLWTRELLGRRVALAATALLATTPVVFELGGYGHPEGPAFLLLNVALLLAVRAMRDRARHPRLLLGAATLVAFLATTLRADVIFAFPLFPLLAPLAAGPARRRRARVLGAAAAALALIGFLAAQQAVVARIPPRLVPTAGGAFTGEVQTLDFFLEYWATAKETRSLLKGIAVWMTGLGPLALAGGLAALVALARRRPHRGFVLAAGGLLLPNAIFWLPDPTPSRHLLVTFLVLAPAAMLWLETVVSKRRFGAAAALFIALNLVAMDLAYPVVTGNYAFHFETLLPRRTNLWVPMGNPITNRLWAQRQVRLEVEEARQLATSGEPRLLVIGGFVSVRLLYLLYSSGPHETEYEWRHGALLYRVTTPQTEYAIYDYGGPPQITPADFVARIAAAGDFADFALAIVPSDRPVVGAASVPPGYREFEFGDLGVDVKR